MQFVGHFIAHKVQTWQYLKSNICATLVIFQILAAFGQISSHLPQAIHLSSSTKICNMTTFGMFVKLDNSAEGLVFYNSMPDYMIFDDKKMIAIGECTRRKYAVGDRVKVKVVNCNLQTGQMEFHLVK